MLKRSLHVGLNYPGTSAELGGCINDAFDWADKLGGLGYTPTLLQEPTGDQILDAIHDGLAGMKRGDRFVFTYSGHGSYVPDSDGDEIDGLDEVICPSDFRSRYIKDDELSAAFDAATSGVRRTFLSDSCHSGTVSRFAGLQVPRRRFMPPHMIMRDIEAADSAVRLLKQGKTVNRSKVPAVLISGCADDEYSYDATFVGQGGVSRGNGAFSRVAIDAYEPGQTMISWFRRIRSGLPTAHFPQTPHLTARLHQRYWKL